MLSKKQLNWKRWYSKNKQKRAADWKKYYKKHQTLLKKRAIEYHIKNRPTILKRFRSRSPFLLKVYKYWHRYKVDLFIVQQAAKISGFRCDICRGKYGPAGAQLDHCHGTGKVRGILCSSCNTALGKFGDSITILTRAQKYLKGEL